MEALTYLDTHVVAWLFAGLIDRFPGRAQERLEQEDLAISPMVKLELQYLFEVGRVTQAAETVAADLEQRIGIEVVDASFSTVIAAALPLSWTRDPFDRLIAAQAITERRPLLTADASMRDNVDLAVWDD